MAAEHEQALSLAFMRSHPAQAARVLEALPAEQAAALFERIPARLGAAVLSAMLPRRAALYIAALGEARALEILAPMGTQPAVAVLRYVPTVRRQALIDGLPTALALASSLLLGYTQDTLGAWADPDVVLLAADTRAADALERMRGATAPHPLVFVADAERRLAGVVGLAALLQAPAAATLATLMQRPVALLAAVAPLAATLAHPGWRHSSLLPVVESGDRLVGVMTRDALERALHQAAPPSAAPENSLPALLALHYWQSLTGLLQGGLALLPQVPALDEGRAGEH